MAPVASQSALIALMLLMRCARNALAVSLASSALHRLAVRMRSSGIQCWYTALSAAIAAAPSGVSWPPMSTRSGRCRSLIAVPSARNSGLLRISNLTAGSEQLRASTLEIASAVLTGTVLFSTTILDDVDTLAIMRAAPSQYVRSAARPAPMPLVLVGVLTDTNTMSASPMCLVVSLLKKRLRPRHALTISSSPGS